MFMSWNFYSIFSVNEISLVQNFVTIGKLFVTCYVVKSFKAFDKLEINALLFHGRSPLGGL